MPDDHTDHENEVDYLELPDHLRERGGDNMPELLRIDPDRGYVKDNVLVVSRRAAQFIEFFRAMRAQPEELRWFAAEIEDGITLL